MIRIRDPRWLALLAAVLMTAAYFVAMLLGTGGRLALPLDDAFIFFQYARELAGGHPFQYNGVGPASGGVTSLATLLIDSLGWLIGFRGHAMVIFTFLVGGAGLFLALLGSWRLARALGSEKPAWMPLFLILNGPLLWGLFAGMDLPLFVAAIVWTLASWAEERAAGPGRRRTVTWASLAAVSRPEGLIFSLLVTLALNLEVRSPAEKGRPGAAWRPGLIVPLLVGLVPGLVLWIATGRPSPTSLTVKGVLGLPGIDAGSWLGGALEYLTSSLRQIFFGFAGDKPVRLFANNGSGVVFYLAPLTLPLFLAGVLPGAARESDERRPGPCLVSLVGLGALLVTASLVVPRLWHWHRYLMPTYVLVLPFAALGLERLLRLVQAASPRSPARALARLGLGVYVALALPGTLYFLLAFAQNSADIAYQQIDLAAWVRGNLPAGSRLGVNDAGALRYDGVHPVLDLEGLVTPALTEPRRQGTSSLYEAIERMPASERPTHLIVYPNWYDQAFVRPHRQIHQRRLLRQTMAGGNPMIVYEADWSLVNSGDLPSAPDLRGQIEGKRLVDRLDVADLVDERAHRYRFRSFDGQYQGPLDLQPADEGGPNVMDGGRLISRDEAFRLGGVTPGRDLTVILRSRAGFRVRLFLDGQEAGEWLEPGRGGSNWTESSFVVPGRMIRSGAPELRVAVAESRVTAYTSYHYWLYQ